MINIEYANAYKEVLELLKYIPKEDYSKIPEKIIRKITKKANPYYDFKYNPEKSFEEQDISEIAQVMISILYRDYWASEEEKANILLQERNNYLLEEEKKREKYDPNHIF